MNFFRERRQRPVKTSKCCICQMPMSEQDNRAGQPACESCQPVYEIASSDPLTAKRVICTADAFQLQQAFDIEIGKPMPRVTIIKEIHRRRMELARRNERPRHGFRVDLVNVDELDRELIASLVSVLSDPAMAETRTRLRDGFLALAVESGEVTWIDTDRVADELAARLVAAALPGSKA